MKKVAIIFAFIVAFSNLKLDNPLVFIWFLWVIFGMYFINFKIRKELK